MTRVSMAELRHRLAHFLDRVEQGERIHVTRRGRVVAVLEPDRGPADSAAQRLKRMQARATIGDVESPLGERWDAQDAGA